MKILITGICGFVGSQLARSFRQHFDQRTLQIVGLDNLSRSASWRNRPVFQEMDIPVYHGDIRCAEDLDVVGPVDFVVDAAANASVLAGVDGRSSSRQLVNYNLTGTVNLLEYCKQHTAGFILLSTSRIYSIRPLAHMSVQVQDHAFVPGHNDIPGFSSAGIREDFSTAAPVSLYGATKLASEQLATEYGHAFGFPVWINRCGVMAGAGQFGKADQGIFAFWLHSWKEHKPLKYIGFGGHGHQVRDCLHPRDLVPLLNMQFQTANDDRPQISNVSGGSASARSLAQLSQWCTQRWGARTVAADSAVRQFDLPWVVLDPAQAHSVWNWSPVTTTEQILAEIGSFADTQPAWIDFSR